MLSADSQVLLTLTPTLTLLCNVSVTDVAAPEMLHPWVAWMMTNCQGVWMRVFCL